MRNIPHVFRPIERWPGTLTKERRRAPFKSSYQQTLDLLEDELRHLGAKSVVLEIALDEREIRIDGLPYARATPAHPGVIVSFQSKKTGDMKFPCDRFSDWESNLRAIALSLEALRKVDRYGVTRRREQYRGWAALPPPPGSIITPMDPQTAVRILNAASGHEGSIKKSEYQGIYREAVKKQHPDAGGSHESWNELQQASEVLKNYFGL